MSNTLGSVEIDLVARVGKLEADMAKATRAVRKNTGTMAAAARKNMKAIGTAFAAAGAAAGAFAVQQIAVIDSMAKAAKAAGISAESLQELRFAAERSGLETRQLDEGMRRFNRRLGEFVNSGGGPAAKAFEALGVEAQDAGGKARSTEEVFNDVVKSLEGFENQSQVSALAAQLFGDDAGPKLALLLAEGSEGVAALRQEKRKYGLVTDEAAASAERANDALTNTKEIFSGTLTRLVADNAEEIAGLAARFSELVLEAGRWWGLIRENNGEIGGLRTEANKLATQINELERSIGFYADQMQEADDITRLSAQVTLVDLQAQLVAARERYAEIQSQLSGVKREQEDANRVFEEAPAIIDEVKVAAEHLTLAEIGLKDAIEEVIVTAEKKLGPATQSLLADFDAMRESTEGAAGDYEDLAITVVDASEGIVATGATIETWADNVFAAFGRVGTGAASISEALDGIERAFSFSGNGAAANYARQLGNIWNSIQSGDVGGAGQGIGELYATARGLSSSGQLAASIGGRFFGGIPGAILGELFNDDGEITPRISINNNQLMQGIRDGQNLQQYVTPFTRETALGVTVQGQQITEALGGANAQTILDDIVKFDQVIADIVRGSGLGDLDAIKGSLLGPGGESSRVYEEGFTTSQILADRFNTIMAGFDESVQNLVGTVQDAEDGIRRLTAAVTLIDVINTDPMETVAETLRLASLTATESLVEMGDALLKQAREADGSTSSLENLAQSATQFQQAAVQALLRVEAARQNVSGITGNTIEGLRYQALGSESEQLKFLLNRAESLTGEIGGLGDAGAIERQIQLINQLVNQAAGIAGTAGLQGGMLDKLIELVTRAEDAAQAQLDDVEEELQDAATRTLNGLADEFVPASEIISTAADTQANAADTLLAGAQEFGSNVVLLGQYLQGLPDVIQVVAPGSEVNAAG